MSELRMILVTTLLLHTAVVVHGQGFMLGSMPYADGDTVLLSDIGDTQADPPGNEALICTTTQTGCCGVNANGISVPADRRGEFYYPNGTMVPTRNGAGSDGFFRGRGYQSISLQRKSSASMDPPTGQYRCDIPDRNGVSHNMTINIGIQCSSNICVDGATCMNSNTCMCPTGYTGNGRSGNGGTGCTDTNECSGNVCVSMATCVNTVGSFTCTCPTGYTGNGRSGNGGTGCTDINECASGADDCVEGATCVNTDGSFTCTCPTGYTGNGRSGNGGTGCTDNNECASGADDCVEGATCVDTDGSFTCTCPSGFTGDGRTSGSGCSDLDECEDPDTCGDGYVCVNTVGSFMCNDINECTSGSPDCVTNATCVNTDGSFTCTCQSGLTGNGRTGGSGCTDIDECTMPGSLVCARNADCQNTPPGSFTCTCRDGFTGDGTSQCTDNDECVAGDHNCVEGACNNTDGSFTCMCPSGFTGDGRTDGIRCTDIDECEDPDRCENGLRCVNTQGSFRCDDIDECTSGTDDCVDGATCVNTDGSFTCTCPSGFTGDGRVSGSGCIESPVQLMLQGNLLSNNSELFIGDIGNISTGSAIICTTDKSPCCSTPPNRFGEWYYPDRSVVPNNAAGEDFFRGRGDDQTIWLNRRNNAKSPTGSFCCELPDDNDMTNRVCVNIRPISISSSGTNTAGRQYQLTCSFFGDAMPTFTWTGPPNDSPLPSDTRNVSDVMSSGSTHISILQFNSLQSSHEGNYTCQAGVVGASLVTASFQVIVQPIITTREPSDEATTTTGDGGGSPEGAGGGVNGPAVAGGIIVVLLVIAVIIVVVVVVFLYWRHRNSEKPFTKRRTPPPRPAPPTKVGYHKGKANGEKVNIGANGEPLIQEFPEDSTAIEGEGVVFKVKVKAHPKPIFVWLHNDREVKSDYSMELDPSDGSLRFHSVEPRHSGTYKLVVKNDEGHIEREVKLTVLAEGENPVISGESALKSSPVPVADFGKYVSNLHSNSNAGFKEQYQLLDSGEEGHVVSVGVTKTNRPLNRFGNITVYDDNRIQLTPLEGETRNYINACYIDGFTVPKKFIATQGPLPQTTTDFWHLVWQEKPPIIVMVTNLKEGNRIKCQQYWPESGRCEYGPFEVSITDHQIFADYTMRKLVVKLSGYSKHPLKVTQYHFTAWPDHGVPDYATSVLAFHRRVKSQHVPTKGPLLVHCSAGVGRTGTYMAIDSVLEQIERDQLVDIPAVITAMRRQRMSMVQTPEQYSFIHDAILESVTCGDTQIQATDLRREILKLEKIDPLNNSTGFNYQFKVLEQVSPQADEVVSKIANANSKKNRNNKYLPSDKNRVILLGEQQDYIHAVSVNGYKRRRAFFIAEGPMKNTVRNFWKMIFDRKCSTIVMLSGLIENGKESCQQYWPTSGTGQYGEFTVENHGEEKLGGFTLRSFSLMESKSGKTLQVFQYHITGWSVGGECSNLKSITDVIEDLTKVQMRTSNKPTVVHCSDTVTRSGMFCAIATTIERCKTEGVVDVFQVVKALRVQKPGAVPTVDNYKLVFQAVLAFLDSFDTYANFS